MPAPPAPFEVLRPLGQGATAEVFEVRVLNDPRRLAAKLLLRQSQKALARFQREGEVVARLRHPGIVAVQGSGVWTDGRPYLLFELIEGRSLAEVLRERGPLPVERTVELGKELAAALAHAHERGVVHRDIKPENILLDRSGQALVADFGVARATDLERLTLSGQIVGTPVYMAPEQIGEGDPGPHTDVYGLGAVLHESLTGEPPLGDAGGAELFARILGGRIPSVRKLRPEVRPDLAQLIQRCLAREPERRPSALDLVDAFDELQRTPAPAPGRRSPLLLAGLLAAGIGLGVGLTLALTRNDTRGEPGGETETADEPPRRTEPPPPPPLPKYDLDVRLRQGERVQIALEVDRRNPQSKMRILSRFAGRVGAVRGSSATIDGRVDRFAFSFQPTGQPRALTFDSALSDGRQHPMLRPLRGFVGARTEIVLDLETGRPRISGVTAHVMRLRLPSMIATPMRAQLNDRSISYALDKVLYVLPGEPVLEGASWKHPLLLSYGEQNLVGRRVCRLAQASEHEARIVSRLEAVVAAGPMRAKRFEAESRWKDGMLVKSEATMWWDTPQGPLRSTWRYTFER